MRDYKRKPRILPREWPLIALLILLALCSSEPAEDQTHNAAGGYVTACGALPPLVGDDC